MAMTEVKEPTAMDAELALRKRVLEKVKIKFTKLDIRPLGHNRYRVNVWAHTDVKSEICLIPSQVIADSFYFKDC